MRSILRGGAVAAVCAVCASGAFAQLVRTGTSANAAGLTAIRDQYRTDLGGGAVAGPAGSFGGVRREINWDAVPNAFSAGNNLPANFFNVNSPRGAVFSFGGGSPGTGFQVSDNAAGGNGVGVEFANLNANYPNQFLTFSPEKLFTPLGDFVYDVTFFLAGTNTPAPVTGFGAIFTDVDLANTSSIQFFDSSNASLGTFFAPVQDNGLSFLGVSFPTASVARVRITQGNLIAGGTENPNAVEFPSDVVVVDDFIYGEPTLGQGAVAPEPASLLLIAPLGAAFFLRRCNRRR